MLVAPLAESASRGPDGPPEADRASLAGAVAPSEAVVQEHVAVEVGNPRLAATGDVTLAEGDATSAEMVTVTLDGVFELLCPAAVAEGRTFQCSLTNTGTENHEWPAVGLMHSSSDEVRALVAGSPVEVTLGSPVTASDIVSGNWWYGDVLLGFARFDWDGEATPMQARTFAVAVADDALHESEETFYVGLIRSGSKNMSAMFLNKGEVVVAASDSLGTDASLADIELRSGPSDIELTVSAGVVAYEVEVGYEVTELSVAPVPADNAAAVAIGGVVLDQPDVGRAGTVLSLPVGTTSVSMSVTSEDGDASTAYSLSVTRLARPDDWAAQVSVGDFSLSCPYRIWEGVEHVCSLTNDGGTAAEWPTVAVMHATLDANRAVVAGDSLSPGSDPSYSRDVLMSLETAHELDLWNYGHGELFRGGVTAARVVYGYQRADLGGIAGAGEQRRVRLVAAVNDDSSPPEMFYVALAADGVTSLSALADNRVPVLVVEHSDGTPPPAVSSVAASDVTATSARLSVRVDRPGQAQLGVFVRWRPEGDTGWVTQSAHADEGSATVEVDALTPFADYDVEASLDQTFPSTRTATATFSTPTSVSLSALSAHANGAPLTLEPAFKFTTTAYATSTDHTETHVTVAATPLDSNATLTWLDAEDNVLHDAVAGTPGFQVALGDVDTTTTLTARLTDAVTSDTLDYTLAVTRLPDTTAPEFQAATASGATMTLTYDEHLDNTSIPGADDFDVRATDSDTGITSRHDVDSVAIDGREVTLTLDAPVRFGDTVTVSYAAGADPIQDLVGLDAASFLGDTLAANTSLRASDATLKVLWLDGVTLKPGFAPGVHSYTAVVANDVTSTTVAVARTDRRASALITPSDASADAGHQVGLGVGLNEITVRTTAEDTTTRIVYSVSVTRDVERVAPALEEASVHGGSLLLRYSEALDEGSRPAGRAFSVEVTDSVTGAVSSRTVDPVSASSRVVTLTLDAPVRHGDTVTVGYTAGREPIQDLAGNDAADLADRAVSNTTAAAADATLAVLSLDGVTLSQPEPGVLYYEATVGNDVTSTTITATPTDRRASAMITPADSSADAGHQVDLAIGLNRLRARVTAENGTRRALYTVAVTRDVERVPPALEEATVHEGSLVLRYSEALDEGSVPAGGDFSVSVTDSATNARSSTTAGSASVTDQTVTLTLDAPVRHRDTVTIGYTAGTNPIRDLAGNDAADLPTQAVANTTPTAADATLRSLSLDQVTLFPSFSPGLSSYTATVANDVTSTTVAATPADPRAAASHPANHDLAIGPNEITVTVTAENGTTHAYTVTVTRLQETDVPTLTSASLDGTALVLTYSEDLDEHPAPAGGDFSVTVTDAVIRTVSSRAIDSVAISGEAITLTLGGPVRHGDTVTMRYTKGDNPIQDLAGNDAADLADRAVSNTTAAAADATLDTLSLDGVTLSQPEPGVLYYEATVGNDVTSTTVTATPTDRRASALITPADSSAGAGHQVGLAIGLNEITVRATAEDTTTRIVYSVSVTRDVEGVALALEEASVHEGSLVLRYSEALDEGSRPAGGDFSVSVTDSATNAVSSTTVGSVSVTDQTVTLTLDAPVRHRDTVTIGYTAGTNPIRDLAGNDAADLPTQAVANTTPTAADATLRSLSLDQVTLLPSFSPGLSSYTATVANDVTSTTVAATPADPRAAASHPANHDLAIGPNEITVTVTAENGTTHAYTVTVTRLQETDVPTLTSASLDGTALVLTYSEDLDEHPAPAGGDFSVTVTDAVTRTVSSRAIDSVRVSGEAITLTLGAPVRHGDIVTMRYTKGDNPIKDLAGNDAENLTRRAVSNTTEATDDATLDTLSLDGVTLRPGFVPGVRSYTAVVANDVTSTTVTATPADRRASASYTAGHDLAVGTNTIIVTVTAESGATRTYTVSVTRLHETEVPRLMSASVDKGLLVLGFSEALDGGSVPAGEDFSVSVTDSVTDAVSSTTVRAASIRGPEVVLTLDAPVRHRDTVTIGYAAGANPIQDPVGNDAADFDSREVTNSTTRSRDTSLAALSLSGVALSPPFSPSLYRYEVHVDHDVAEITVSQLAVDSRVRILIEPADRSPAAGHQVRLASGRTTISVTVTAEDDTICVPYTVEVTRDRASASREQDSPARDVSKTPLESRTLDQVTATADAAVSTTDLPGLELQEVGAARAVLAVSLDQPAQTPQAVFVRYRAAATAGSGGWTTVASSVAGDSGVVTVFGLDPSTDYTAQVSTHPSFPAAPSVSLSFTTAAAPVLSIDDDQYTVSANMYLAYGDHQRFRSIQEIEPPYDSDRGPTNLIRYFGMARVSGENIDDEDLSFAVESLPDKSQYQFCWYSDVVVDVDETTCGDLEVKVHDRSGWLYLYADHGSASRSATWRASPYMYDFPTERLELSSADSSSGLRVFKDVIVRPPALAVDCTDYPLLNRDRYNCLFNAERLPPAPEVGEDEDLLHESLALEQPEENYSLVFREEFDTEDTKTGCENLATLDSSVWAHGLVSCSLFDTNGNSCEGMSDGAYRMSISYNCRAGGLQSNGNLEYKYGYMEVQFTLRLVRYSGWVNHNITLGGPRRGRNLSLPKYNVPVNNVEELTTNVDIEINFVECRNSRLFCKSHQYINRPPIEHFDGVSQRRTLKYLRFCQQSSISHVFNDLDCPTSVRPLDLEVTITRGFEWTPRGYHTFVKAEGVGDGNFIPIRKRDILTQRYIRGGTASFGGKDRDAYFESLDPDDLTLVREQLGVSHVPARISAGVWQQGLTEDLDTNEVWMEINYIRIFQPEDKYASMEPVYK